MIESEQQVEKTSQKQDNFDRLAPQIKIYNRYFYLRNAHQQDLQQEANRQIQQLASKPKLTPNSYIILVQKLQQQVTELFQKHIQQQDHLNFYHFQTIFTQLAKLSQTSKEEDQFLFQLLITQLWLLLVQYNLEVSQITKNKFTSLVHILFCPYSLKLQEMIALIDHAFPNLQDKRLQYIQEYPQASEQVLDSEGLIKLWLKIKRTHLNTFSQEKKNIHEGIMPSFKPEINPKSRQYASRSLRKYLSNNRLDNIKTSKLNELSGYISQGKELSYHQILYKRGLEKEQILKTNRDQTPPKDPEKTITSSQAKKLVQNLYIVKERTKDVDYSKIKEKQELKLCTFQPITIQYHKRGATSTVKNYSKEIERFQKARKEKMKQKQIYDQLGQVKSMSSGPPSMVERQKPKLILEIKVGERVVQLKLKGDEEPRIAAKKFVIKHGLDDSMQQVLESVIQEQIAALQF